MPQDLIYLDHAATTPMRPEVRAAMEPFLDNRLFGNPSSQHRPGQHARSALEEARRKIADVLAIEPQTVVFTSGGTEADNLAVLGGALAAREAARPFRVAVGATEHKAVLDAARAVGRMGGDTVELPVDTNGLVEFSAVDDAVRSGAAVVSLMWVNNEVGTVNDVPALAERFGGGETAIHTDAVQAIGKVPVHVPPGIAMMTISAHKIGGPKGVGALIVRDATRVRPLLHGGGQQAGIRPGTENIAGAVGLAIAVELAVREREALARHVAPLREELERGLRRAVSDTCVHGVGGERAPHVSSVAFPGTRSDALLMQFDVEGVACSAGSACASGSVTPSHVLRAMGIDAGLASSTLRFSLSHQTTAHEIQRVVELAPEIVARARAATPATSGQL